MALPSVYLFFTEHRTVDLQTAYENNRRTGCHRPPHSWKRLFGIPDQVKGVRPPLPPLDRSNSSVPETCLPASQSSAPRRALQNRYKSSVSFLGLPHNQGPRLGGLNPGQEGGRLEARCQQGHTPSKDPGGIASINVTSSNDPTWSLICESTAQNRELYFHMAISLYAPLGPNLPPLSFTEQAGI